MSVDYSLLLSQLEDLEADSALVAAVPDHLRERLSHVARLVSVRLETPSETLARLLICQPAEEACVRIGADMNLFSALTVDDTRPKTVDQLASATEADPALLSMYAENEEQREIQRLLRCLSANGAVWGTPDGYALSPSLALLSDTNMAQAYGPCEDFLRTNYTTLPHFLRSTKYQEPRSATDTVIQRAFNMPQKLGMDIVGSNPVALKAFSVLMSTWQDGFVQFQSQYPVESQVIAAFDESQSDTVFVDVGGGFGQKAIALKTAFPHMPGRIIVQDLSYIIDLAPQPNKSLAIELMSHDFFQEQPVKGAKIYYLRQVLHNWTNDKAIQVLNRMREAMTPGYSRLIIHEIVMPERNPGRWATSQDLEMLNMFATQERTQEQWTKLCKAGGFSTVNFLHAANSAHEAIVEVSL